MLEHGSRGRSNKLGDQAVALGNSSDPLKNDVCWSVVIGLLGKCGIVSEDRRAAWLAQLAPAPGEPLRWDGLLPPECPSAVTLTAFRSVPRGSIVGFFIWRDGNLALAHAAIALANCKVIGNNGSSVGLPADMNEIGDMSTLDWGSGRVGSSYSFMRKGERISVLVRYRDIDSIGYSSASCAVM